MCIVKVVNEKYRSFKDVRNLIGYAMNESHCRCGLCGATCLRMGTQDEMTAAMWNVKREFGKTDGRQLLHIVVSFDKVTEGWMNPWNAYKIAYDFARIELCGQQVVFGVHDNTDSLHIHFVVNSVSYVNGIKFGIGHNVPYVYQKRIECMMRTYMPKMVEEIC